MRVNGWRMFMGLVAFGLIWMPAYPGVSLDTYNLGQGLLVCTGLLLIGLSVDHKP